jgi:hypothetical protein
MNILKLCEEIKNHDVSSLDEFNKIVDDNNIDIHQHDDLLLYYAAKYGYHDINSSLVSYLLEHNANPFSRNGRWIHYALSCKEIDEKLKDKYFYLFKNAIHPEQLNLFNAIHCNAFNYFKILVNDNYPMSIQRIKKLSLEEYQYLKSNNKFKQYWDRAQTIKNAPTQIFCEDRILDAKYHLITNCDDLVNYYSDFYETFPNVSHIDSKTQSILDKKEYEKLPIRNVSFNSSMDGLLLALYEKAPDYFEYYIQREDPFFWANLSLPILEKILHYQDVSYHHDSNHNLKHCKNENLLFLLTHLKLNIQSIIRICSYLKLEPSIALSIFDEYQDKAILNKFLYDLQTQNIKNARPFIRDIRQKINQSQINLDLIKASRKGNLDALKNLISQGADIHTEHDICLYYAYKYNHSQIIEYLYPLSLINQENFALALKSEKFSIISFYLESDIYFNRGYLFKLDNDELISLIIQSYEKKIIDILKHHPEEVIWSKNTLIQQFCISHFDKITDFNLFSNVLAYVAYYNPNEEVLIKLVNTFMTNFQHKIADLSERQLINFYREISHCILDNGFLKLSEYCLTQKILSVNDLLLSFPITQNKSIETLHYLFSLSLEYQFFTSCVLEQCLIQGDIKYVNYCENILLMIENITYDMNSQDFDEQLKISLTALFDLYLRKNGDMQELKNILYLNINESSHFLFGLIEVYQEKERLDLILNDDEHRKKIRKV